MRKQTLVRAGFAGAFALLSLLLGHVILGHVWDEGESLSQTEPARPPFQGFAEIHQSEDVLRDVHASLEEPEGPIFLADGEAAPSKEPAPAIAPGKLPDAANAAPINGGPVKQQTSILSIIEQELPKASAAEREVWQEELKGLSPETMRGMLRMRRRFGSDPPFKATPLAVENNPKPKARVQVDVAALPLQSNVEMEIDEEVLQQIQPSLSAIRLARDVILNNIANAGTIGFKRSRVLFTDLPYQHLVDSGQPDGTGQPRADGVSVGMGVEVAATQPDFSAGRLQKTGRKLDLAIVGDGFFQIQDLQSGMTLYSRAGAFTTNAEGQVQLVGARMPLEPTITVPPDTLSIHISKDGTVSVKTAGASAFKQLGQIELAHFINSAGLECRGGNTYAVTDASGQPLVGLPGNEGRGTIKQGYLECSNVRLSDELAELKQLSAQWSALHQAARLLPSSQTRFRPLADSQTLPLRTTARPKSSSARD